MTPKFSKIETDTLRGLAILAVVFHHDLLWMANTLLAVSLKKSVAFYGLNAIAKFLQPVRLPLFTILSGMLYALKPVSTGTVQPFMQGKIRRILIPLFCISTLKFFEIYLIRGELSAPPWDNVGIDGPEDFWKMWFFHFGHLWFLQAIFIIFVTIMLVDLLGLMNNLKAWLGWLAFLTILPIVYDVGTFFSVGGASNLIVFFFFGAGLTRFRETIFQPRVMAWAWLGTITGMAVYVVWQLKWLHFNDTGERLILVFVGLLGALCLLSLRFKFAWLAKIGAYSYTIYLFHVIIFESHLLFDSLLAHGPLGQFLWFAMMLVFAVSGSIAIDKFFSRIPVLRTLLLGKKTVTEQ